jgi:hypothetical protein
MSPLKKNMDNKSAMMVFTNDNTSNIRKALEEHKNILICGIEGVGKITHTVQAVKDRTNVCYLGNPVDYEGKMRPGSVQKYLGYIRALKHDIKIIEDIEGVFLIDEPIILIIDEIYGRSVAEFVQIGRLLDRKNIQIIQITGCIKNMKHLIDKMDIILELHVEGAFSVDKDLAQAICRILGREKPAGKLF